MAKRYWLIKSEPEAYSFDRLVKEGSTLWDGVRNYRARNNLQAMKEGEEAFFYHSVSDKQIVGIVRISKAGLDDPRDDSGTWAAVEIEKGAFLHVSVRCMFQPCAPPVRCFHGPSAAGA